MYINMQIQFFIISKSPVNGINVGFQKLCNYIFAKSHESKIYSSYRIFFLFLLKPFHIWYILYKEKISLLEWLICRCWKPKNDT